MSAQRLVENFFRHEYGRLVASLSRRVGFGHIEAVEDSVQAALLEALESWTRGGLPDNPSAWLFRAARNELVTTLRKQTRRDRILSAGALEYGDAPSEATETHLANEMPDDVLRMLFVACDEAIPLESQLVFTLKTLCGFDVREIAIRLFTTEANVYKRLTRARQRLRESLPRDELTQDQFAARLPAVHSVLYLMFTEGYTSSSGELPIRRELCDEATRLAALLAEQPVGETPETYALLALMHLHGARLDSRQNEAGGLLLLEEQDRARWDRRAIEAGLTWLAKSAYGDTYSRYHAEASIAAEHCLAPSLEETRWSRIADAYALLEQFAPSPLHRLNRAVAVAQSQGAQAGLSVLERFVPPAWLAGSYQWYAVLADLHRRGGDRAMAERYRRLAIDCAPTAVVRELLQRRLSLR